MNKSILQMSLKELLKIQILLLSEDRKLSIKRWENFVIRTSGWKWYQHLGHNWSAIARLICTMKSNFEGATWEFSRHKIEKIYGSNHPDFFLGRHPFFFWFTLWNPAFFSGCHLEKNQVEFHPIFSVFAKLSIFSKLKIGCRLKGWVTSPVGENPTILETCT